MSAMPAVCTTLSVTRIFMAWLPYTRARERIADRDASSTPDSNRRYEIYSLCLYGFRDNSSVSNLWCGILVRHSRGGGTPSSLPMGPRLRGDDEYKLPSSSREERRA